MCADSGGRGRPRVTFDVTQGLSAAGVGVFMADGELGVVNEKGGCYVPHSQAAGMVLLWLASQPDSTPSRCLPLLTPRPTRPMLPTCAVYIERPDVDAYGCAPSGGPVAQEMHRFLIHMPGEHATSSSLRSSLGSAACDCVHCSYCNCCVAY